MSNRVLFLLVFIINISYSQTSIEGKNLLNQVSDKMG